MDEKIVAKVNAFDEKMYELIQKVHAMYEKYPNRSKCCSDAELRELCVYTRDNDYVREGLQVVDGYDSEIPNQLALKAFVIDKVEHSEWYMNIFRGFLGDIEEYLKDESHYPKLCGYLSILHDRMRSAD